jgi:hypothetical protein
MRGLTKFIRRRMTTKAIKKGPEKPKPTALEQKFHKVYIADRAVDLDATPEFRGDAFPISGPYCWLDRPNALLEVERRQAAGELSDDEASMCKQWIFEGYYIAPGLIDAELLDRVWTA